MGHGFHGYVSHNQMVHGSLILIQWNRSPNRNNGYETGASWKFQRLIVLQLGWPGNERPVAFGTRPGSGSLGGPLDQLLPIFLGNENGLLPWFSGCFSCKRLCDTGEIGWIQLQSEDAQHVASLHFFPSSLIFPKTSKDHRQTLIANSKLIPCHSMPSRFPDFIIFHPDSGFNRNACDGNRGPLWSLWSAVVRCG